MTKRKSLGLATTLIALLAFSGTAIFAQEETATVVPPAEATSAVVPPAAFTDGRINDTTGLGGLAIYCVDQNSNTHVTTFENGSITVWGVGDQKYITLTAAELRGSTEITQQPSVMEAQMTEDASMMMQPNEMMTEEASEMMAEATPMAMFDEPILLAQATTPNGLIGFFSFGADEFALQGHDDKGAFFTYSWTGCSTGKLEHTTAPYLPMLEMTPMSEMMMTAEATTSP